jgi:hypothetical protein
MACGSNDKESILANYMTRDRGMIQIVATHRRLPFERFFLQGFASTWIKRPYLDWLEILEALNQLLAIKRAEYCSISFNIS